MSSWINWIDKIRTCNSSEIRFFKHFEFVNSNVIAHVSGKKDAHAHKKWHMTHLSSKHVFKIKHMWKIPFRQCKYNSNGSTKRFNCFWYVFLFSLLETRYFEIELFDLWYWHENQFNYKTDGDLVSRVDWQRNPVTLDHEFSRYDNWPSVFISFYFTHVETFKIRL